MSEETEIIDRIIKGNDLSDDEVTRRFLQDVVNTIEVIQQEIDAEYTIKSLASFYELSNIEREALKAFLKPDFAYDGGGMTVYCVNKSRIDSKTARILLMQNVIKKDGKYYCASWDEFFRMM